MVEEGGSSIIIFGVGLLAGISISYLILKGKEQQPAVLTQQPQTLTIPIPSHDYEYLRDELRRLTIELQRQRQENNDLRVRLQIASPQGEVIPPYVKDVPLTHKVIPNKDNKIQAMQNEETWEIKKDKRGRLEGVTVHRRVSPVG